MTVTEQKILAECKVLLETMWKLADTDKTDPLGIIIAGFEVAIDMCILAADNVEQELTHILKDIKQTLRDERINRAEKDAALYYNIVEDAIVNAYGAEEYKKQVPIISMQKALRKDVRAVFWNLNLLNLDESKVLKNKFNMAMAEIDNAIREQKALESELIRCCAAPKPTSKIGLFLPFRAAHLKKMRDQKVKEIVSTIEILTTTLAVLHGNLAEVFVTATVFIKEEPRVAEIRSRLRSMQLAVV